MTLDEIEKLARHADESEERDLHDITECRRIEAINTLTGAARGATSKAADLARAVLAMLPVAKAAVAHENARRECQRTGRHHGMLVLASEMLEDAVDTFTATSASEGK